MSTRIRDENLIQSSRRTGHGPTKKVLGNENTITPNKPSLRRPTLASSLKATPKPDPKSKASRTVLAPLAKPNPNATPRLKTSSGPSIDGKPLPKPLSGAGKLPQTPGPGPKKAVARSTKASISIYTPARSRPKALVVDENEVEFSYPRPPALEERLDFSGGGAPAFDDLGVDEPPEPEVDNAPSDPDFGLVPGNADSPVRLSTVPPSDLNFDFDFEPANDVDTVNHINNPIQ